MIKMPAESCRMSGYIPKAAKISGIQGTDTVGIKPTSRCRYFTTTYRKFVISLCRKE